MKFTGERYVPTEPGRIRLEHYHRYATVLGVVAGKTVLDVACGEGYGAALMSDVALSVVGVDIADEAVNHASRTYKNRSNLAFVQGSAHSIGFADAAFDVIVSFETIEHLVEQAEMLAEFRRLLRPNGVLVISSPNRPIYAEENDEPNPFHLRELDFIEFNALLKVQFPAVQYYGQRMMIGSVIQPVDGDSAGYRAWQDDGTSIRPKSGKLSDPVYFLAVCGSSQMPLPVLDSSVVYPARIDLVKHYVGFAKWAKSLDQTVAEREKEIARLNVVVSEHDELIGRLNRSLADRLTEIDSFRRAAAESETQVANLTQTLTVRDSLISALSASEARFNSLLANLNQSVSERDLQIGTLNNEIVRRGEWALSLDAELSQTKASLAAATHSNSTLNNEIVRRGEWATALDAELSQTRADLAAVTRSHSWRLTLPLREARRWISSPRQQARRYAGSGLRQAKRLYQKLPLSYRTKALHRRHLGRHFPKLMLLSGSYDFGGRPAKVDVVVHPVARPVPDLIADLAIDIPVAVNPRVSIVIPVYGKIEYTLKCLQSIVDNLPSLPLEIIVVDDCSPDDSVEVLERIRGIRLIRNAENQGFVRSCNRGALSANGEYLCFLNNDTEVASGWLDALIRTFAELPQTGLVGSKLVYPDGRLQEAGGIIWQDGSAWNFGRLQDPSLPALNYAREVDYCSGASIAIPKSLFVELGGFDEHYAPAYYEDADLALKVRERGYRVIYQPLSTVVHYEGITSGTDTSHGAKAYQVSNAQKLYERWKGRLSTHQAPGQDVDAAKDRTAKRRVLVLDHCTPTPDQDAGSLLAFNLMVLLREMDFQVTFIPESNFLFMPRYTTALQRVGIEVLYAPHVVSVEAHLKEAGNRYDLAFLFRPQVVQQHVEAIRRYCPRVKVLYHTVDLHFLRMQREAELTDDSARMKQATQMKATEYAAIRAADATIVPSTAEFEVLRPELPDAPVYVLPLIMSARGTAHGYSDRRDVVFVGGYQHAPNVDAVKFFVSEVMPPLRKRLPNIRFVAVGSNPPAEIRDLATHDVEIAGFVEDLDSLFERMRIAVAPLRYGAGVKGKIGSAMAVGLPVVATSLAIEGMSLSPGENILVADGAEAFAAAIGELYHDESLWNRLSDRGLEFARDTWGAGAAWHALSAVLTDLGFAIKRPDRPLHLYSDSTDAFREKASRDAVRPVFVAHDRQQFETAFSDPEFATIRAIEEKLVRTTDSDVAAYEAFCVPCDRTVRLMLDMASGGTRGRDKWNPNWRETLVCPFCRMNNRQRLIAALVKQRLGQRDMRVYFMEQVTPIYQWALATFPEHQLFGSEYLGDEYQSGQIIKGIRHEDVTNLSFDDASLDLIVSNDVLEHVPDPHKALAECARVLRNGGGFVATIPFHNGADISVVRAEITASGIEHRLPPMFHGNPVSSEGSLVFTDFGWDLLALARDVGFKDMHVAVYASSQLGHLGGGQLVFEASNTPARAPKQTTLGGTALNILGEILWHSATIDPSIVSVSREHMREILSRAKRYLPNVKRPRFLEVAAYAHVTGYLLAQKRDWSVTLSDISIENLALGAHQAEMLDLDTTAVRRVAVDFHDLPFPDGAFDIVYMASALHHTLQWQIVLEQLLRVIANGGILILQNEPCKRDFCLYKFQTNRPENFSPVETELDRLGILKTVAQPYPGSRPEALFGMIENQSMPLPEILNVMRRHGAIEELRIDSSASISTFEEALINGPRDEAAIHDFALRELTKRLVSIRDMLTDADRAMGIRLPEDSEVDTLALKVARSIVSLPSWRHDTYETALASIFGGAITAVVKKRRAPSDAANPESLRYNGGSRNGVVVGFPPLLSRVLELSNDLLPNIQTATTDEIEMHFPADAWAQNITSGLRYLVLRDHDGPMLLRPPGDHGRCVVLLRIYGDPNGVPFRVQLCANGQVIAAADVHQAESFILRGELSAVNETPMLSITVHGLDRSRLHAVPVVTIAAARVVSIAVDS